MKTDSRQPLAAAEATNQRAPRSAVLARYLPSPEGGRAPVLQARVASRQLELPFGAPLPLPALRHHPLRTA